MSGIESVKETVSEAASLLDSSLGICANIEFERVEPTEINQVLLMLDAAKQEIEKASRAIRQGLLPVVECAVS